MSRSFLPLALVAVLAAVGLAACTPAAPRFAPTHPANPDAPVGRLAGPPAALRAGVVTEPPPPAPAGPPAHAH